MDNGSLLVTITTPHRKWQFEGVNSISAPGVMGGFQVLFNHAPLLSQIDIGEIKLEINKTVDRFSTSGGFLEVLNNKVSLLLESCERSDSIDLERAKQAAEQARRLLKEGSAATDITVAELALARALNRIRIAGKGV